MIVKDLSCTSIKYRIIYADPPWCYTEDGLTGVSNKDSYGNAEKHYPTMSLKDICNLPIKSIIEKNAVLFLWVTSPFLQKSFSVIESWGFTYKANFIWNKMRHNFGYYNSVRHELLLVATKGSCTPDSSTLKESVINLKRDKIHSRKPIEFRDMIDELYLTGNRIELFARNIDDSQFLLFDNIPPSRKEWDTWGNEA